MWLEAEFQGSWHLYKTFPTPAISLLFGPPSFFFLSVLYVLLSLCHYL